MTVEDGEQARKRSAGGCSPSDTAVTLSASLDARYPVRKTVEA